MAENISKTGYSDLIRSLAAIIEQGRKTAVRAVNTALVTTYWLMGRRIVEFEQKGKLRAEYGEATLRRISDDLMKRFGKGFGFAHVKKIRQFYVAYSGKGYTVCGQSGSTDMKIPVVRSEFSASACPKLPLSWSHYRLLMQFEEPFQRKFYEAECIRGNWSVRQLDRQIQSMLYERTALSKKKLAVIAHAHKKPIVLKPQEIHGNHEITREREHEMVCPNSDLATKTRKHERRSGGWSVSCHSWLRG